MNLGQALYTGSWISTITDEILGDIKNELSESLQKAAESALNATLNGAVAAIAPQRVTIQSHWLLRAIVPGQTAWDNARTAAANGEYGSAALGMIAMGGEIAITVVTLGQSTITRNVARTTFSQAAENAVVRVNPLTPSQTRQIQAFTDRFGAEVNVVGSRASGTARATSDFDYVIQGNAKLRNSAEYYLPRGSAGGANNRGIDIFKEPLDPSRPFIQFRPNQPPVVGGPGG